VYKVFVEEAEYDWETLTSFSSTNTLTIADAQLTPDGMEYAPFSILNMRTLRQVHKTAYNSKTEFFVKAILHHRNNEVFRNHMYEVDEEIFVKYNLADQLIL
jgi:hypothetical protein